MLSIMLFQKCHPGQLSLLAPQQCLARKKFTPLPTDSMVGVDIRDLALGLGEPVSYQPKEIEESRPRENSYNYRFRHLLSSATAVV
jgi:hypothetical protein